MARKPSRSPSSSPHARVLEELSNSHSHSHLAAGVEHDYDAPGTDPAMPEEFRAAVNESINRAATGKTNVLPVHFTAPSPRRAFIESFEILGGVPRLVLWANQNYGTFMQLFSKMVSNGAQVNVNSGQEVQINLSWLTPERLSSVRAPTVVENAPSAPPAVDDERPAA